MDRRRRGYEYVEPTQINPHFVDFGNPQIYDEARMARLENIMDVRGARYDAGQALFAKQLEDVGALDLTALPSQTRQQSLEILSQSPEKLHQMVKDKYQGDYGAGFNDVMQQFSKDRALMGQLNNENKKAAQAFAEYQDLVKRGMAPQKYVPGQGMVTVGFEDYHENRMPGFNEEGKFVGGQYNALRGASDLTGYLDKGISKTLSNRLWQDILKENEKTPGFLEQVSRKGYTSEQLERFFNSENFDKEAFIQQLEGEVPHLAAEFEGVNDSELFDYAKNIIKTQVGEQLMRDYRQDPHHKPVEFNDSPLDPYYGLYTRNTVEDKGKVEAKRKELNDILTYIDSPEKESTYTYQSRYASSNNPTIKEPGNLKNDRNQLALDNTKKQFASIWNYIDQNAVELLGTFNVDEKAKNRLFIQHLINLDLPANLAKENNLIISPIDNNVFKDLKTSLFRQMSSSTLYSGKTGKLGGEVFGNNGEDIQNIEFVPSKGNIVFTIKDGKQYSLKDKDMANLPNELRWTLQTIEKLYAGKFDYEFDTNSITSPVVVNMNVLGRNIPVIPEFTWTVNPQTGQKIFTKKYKTPGGKYITDNSGTPLEEPVIEFQDMINPFFARIAATQGVTK